MSELLEYGDFVFERIEISHLSNVDVISDFEDGYAIFSLETDDDSFNYYGLINDKGVITIPPDYNEILKCAKDVYLTYSVAEINGGTIRHADNSLCTVETFQTASFLDSGLMPVGKNVKSDDTYVTVLGYLDENFEMVIPLQYEKANSFCSGLAAVAREDGTAGFINNRGEIVIPFQFYDTDSFYTNYAMVIKKDEDLYGLIDKKGGLVVPFLFDDLTYDLAGIYVFKKDGSFGIFAPEFFKQILLPSRRKYEFYRLNDEYCVYNGEAYLDKHTLLINLHTGEISFMKYASVYLLGPYRPGYWRSKCFFVGRDGWDSETIDVFDAEMNVLFDGVVQIDRYSDGMFAVQKNKQKSGYVDLNGNYVIEPRFIDARSFDDGLAIAAIYPAEYGLIDMRGNAVLPFEYVSITYLGNGIYDCFKAGKRYLLKRVR